MADAVLDGISYFTNGLCIPTNVVDGVAYFTNGLVIPTGVAPIVPGGGVGGARNARDRFINQAKDEAELIQTLIFLITVVDE
jgi:hypothetical protein